MEPSNKSHALSVLSRAQGLTLVQFGLPCAFFVRYVGLQCVHSQTLARFVEYTGRFSVLETQAAHLELRSGRLEPPCPREVQVPLQLSLLLDRGLLRSGERALHLLLRLFHSRFLILRIRAGG